MASSVKELHFILIPLMAQGHMIPIVDIARILATRGAAVSLITTPLNANRFKNVVARARQSLLRIELLEIPFPATEVGLPEGCENVDMLPSYNHGLNFWAAMDMLQEPVEKLLRELRPAPSCIISDMNFSWTTDVALKLHIPRLVFHGPGCFSTLCMHILRTYGILDDIISDSDRFVIPRLPDRIEVTKGQVAVLARWNKFRERAREAEKGACGVVVNSFQELEHEYAKAYAEELGKKVWCIGPVSLCNENDLDKAERGNEAAIDELRCLEWLGSQQTRSVIYVCLGSLSRLSATQMIELGLGLELTNQPFIWCIRHKPKELERWFLEEGFEERVKGRGLVVHGWAPQVLILSHQAIRGFLTHCGWNSTLEGICAGMPMITWPHFAEQFLNEKFIVELLKIGVRIGVELPVLFGEEDKMGVLVSREDIVTAVESLMNESGESEQRRERARQLQDMAKWAMQENGSSHSNIDLLIQDILEQVNCRR